MMRASVMQFFPKVVWWIMNHMILSYVCTKHNIKKIIFGEICAVLPVCLIMSFWLNHKNTVHQPPPGIGSKIDRRNSYGYIAVSSLANFVFINSAITFNAIWKIGIITREPIIFLSTVASVGFLCLCIEMYYWRNILNVYGT